ncbi:PPR domain-containing protein [Cephalotus follicularis]|uniref:PPR domain-containing protein n=1 Tax=Cephalotus follicularis TaxID=3775 RepID=A0A1Q3BR01_CEPFO|nr:PPR domain-containing protein [Cephalotus follicularis]
MKRHFSAKVINLLNQVHHQNSSRVLASLFSTKTLNPSSASSSNCLRLYDRIIEIRNPKVSIVPVLDQWVDEGNAVHKHQLQSLVRSLKSFQRFNHALEISDWMANHPHFILSPKDVAIRLNLICRVHGLQHAENHFENLPISLKTQKVYGALLSGSVEEKNVEKAELIVQKMREMGMASSPFPYNMLINLYSQTREFDKIDMLMQEMEMKGIPQDTYTLNNRLYAYVAASDISGMEKILSQMEEDPNFYVSWQVYSTAANGYLKVGMTETALLMLKKMEGMMPPQGKKLALEFLVTLYAKAGDKDELYRVWNMYKPLNEIVDSSYACMIDSLAKLDDIEGAERIFEEWESQCTFYDFRVLNRLLVAYCNKGFLDKAEAAVNKAVVGKTPYAPTWNVLAIGYIKHNQMPKAVDMLKRSFLRHGWVPNSDVVTACLDYLEGQGDLDEMEDMINSLKKLGPLTRDAYHRLLRTCLKAGKSVDKFLDQMETDGFTADEETRKILEPGEFGPNWNFLHGVNWRRETVK